MRTQFGSFDGLDNRKTILKCFERMGHGLNEQQAGQVRAAFLEGIVADSTTGFSRAPVRVDACSAVEAYQLFIAICGCLGVPIEEAAISLEEELRNPCLTRSSMQ